MTRCLEWFRVRFQDQGQRCQGKGWREDTLAGSHRPPGGGDDGSADWKGPQPEWGCQDYGNCGASSAGETEAGREGLGRGLLWPWSCSACERAGHTVLSLQSHPTLRRVGRFSRIKALTLTNKCVTDLRSKSSLTGLHLNNFLKNYLPDPLKPLPTWTT